MHSDLFLYFVHFFSFAFVVFVFGELQIFRIGQKSCSVDFEKQMLMRYFIGISGLLEELCT